MTTRSLFALALAALAACTGTPADTGTPVDTGTPADTGTPVDIDPAPVSCSSCTHNGDGSITLHVYPGAAWSASVGTLGDDSEGLHNADPANGLEASALLDVSPGDRLLGMVVEVDGIGTVLIERDPPEVAGQGSSRWIGGGNATGGDAFTVTETVGDVAGYHAVVWLAPGNLSHVARFDVLIEPAP